MGNDLLIYNIGCLATPLGYGPQKGEAQGAVAYYRNCCIYIKNGIIEKIGEYDKAFNYESFGGDELLNAGGCLVTPGLVDCHTHLVFGGWRHKEFPLKLAGASYLDILERGGGILSTVRHTREAGIDELYSKSSALLDECLSYGVTTIEAKSGYGLDEKNELKCLEVIKRLKDEHIVDVVPTFMGAHAVPGEYTGNGGKYAELVINMLPLVAENKLAKYCDVFCEKSAFSIEETRKILTAAKELGFGLKMHADEITNLGGARLAAEMGCVSAEHLIKSDADGINALAASDTVAVCLPCTSFYLNEDFAPARAIVSAGGAVAVATDFNPGSSPNLNLQLAMSMACYKYRLSPEEVLTSVTLNAAAAVGRGKLIGSIETGKKGDLVLWDADDLSYIFYRYGSNLARTVVKNGKIVRQS